MDSVVFPLAEASRYLPSRMKVINIAAVSNDVCDAAEGGRSRVDLDRAHPAAISARSRVPLAASRLVLTHPHTLKV